MHLLYLRRSRDLLPPMSLVLVPMQRRNFAVDYSAEVAFEKKPAAGFFDVGEEQLRSKEMQQVGGAHLACLFMLGVEVP